MAAAAPPTGLLDLEKELSCSICTDTLYQPLTLLDCLHTFCGSCLKFWFAWQASQALADEDDLSRRAHPYTCPSCRAKVRETRPDAKITTLLDMYLMANPSRAKSSDDKEEIDLKYKPGENVIPKLDNSEDRRMVEEVRRLSLREGHGSGRGYQRGVRHQGRSPRPGGEGRDERQQAQQLEHQSSLRSLISADDVDAAEMEEEILRQILEDGLLEGIDLASMTPEQQDQLSERIAEAYRQRHSTRNRIRQRREAEGSTNRMRSRDTSRRRDNRSPARSPRRSPTDTPPRSPRRPHARSTGEAQPSPRHAVVQRDDLLQAYPAQRPGHQRRSSDGRRQTSPAEAIRSTQAQAARSVTDLSSSPQSGRRSRRASHGISGEDTSHSHQQVFHHIDSPTQASPVQSPPQSPPAISEPNSFGSRNGAPRNTNSSFTAPSTIPLEHSDNQHPHVIADAHYHAGTHVTAPFHPRTSSMASSNAIPGLARLKAYPEPNISCERCSKAGIQYELHHNCSSCKDGRYNICHRCYKLGRGCENWFGFGYSAWERYQKKGAPTPELPHTLLACRYRRPRTDEIASASPGGTIMTREPPAKRRRVGAFCFSCHEFADDFFYKCDQCNQGEWGYCKNCVSKGRCCNHPLLPLAWTGSRRQKSSQNDLNQGIQATFAPTPDPQMIQPFPPSTTGPTRQYRPLTVTTTCERCRRPISSNQSRFHCFHCNDGSAEWCKDCYTQIQQSAAIRHEDGEKGWRRCPRGHRMIVYVFQDTQFGQARVIVHDLVGGHFLKDEPDGGAGMTPTADERRYTDGRDGQSVTTSRAAMQPQPGEVGRAGSTSSKFPPGGGVGKRCLARWSWVPDDGVVDELSFPKGAEVSEVLDVNETWSEGSYAGRKGVFPTNHVRVLEFVTM